MVGVSETVVKVELEATDVGGEELVNLKDE